VSRVLLVTALVFGLWTSGVAYAMAAEPVTEPVGAAVRPPQHTVYRNLPNWMEEPARAPVRSIGYVHPSTATLDATKDPEQAATELVGSRGANVMLDVLDGGTRSGAPASPAKMTLRSSDKLMVQMGVLVCRSYQAGLTTTELIETMHNSGNFTWTEAGSIAGAAHGGLCPELPMPQ